MPKLRIDPGVDRFRDQFAQCFRDLRLDPRVWLAEIVTARIQRTAQRADRAGIGRAGGHVLGLERMLADTALDRLEVLPPPLWLAPDVIFSLPGPAHPRRPDNSDAHP